MIQHEDVSFGKLHALEVKLGGCIKVQSTADLLMLLQGGGAAGGMENKKNHSPPSNYLRREKKKRFTHTNEAAN